jgi:hypothetical protein
MTCRKYAISSYIETYEHLYDDEDKYRDFFYELYTEFTEYSNEKYFTILGKTKFCEFFNFCLKHANKPYVDYIIQTAHIKNIVSEIPSDAYFDENWSCDANNYDIDDDNDEEIENYENIDRSIE